MEGLLNIETGYEYPFIGRKYDVIELDKKWSSCRIFGIFGIRAVGKSRFIREYLRQKAITTLQLQLRTIRDVGSLYSTICASLHIEPNPQATNSFEWIKQIIEELKKASYEKSVAVFFDNAEDAAESAFKDSLLSLCTAVAKQCPNVKVIISSTTRFQFSQLSKVYCLYELKPMWPTDSKLLLQTITPEIDLGSYSDAIVELSEGLPLLILMIGAELKGKLTTPEEMVSLLLVCRLQTLSKDCYPVEDRVADVYKSFLERLSTVYRDSLTTLDFIPSSFNAEEAGDLLDFETVAMAKHRGLKPILARHMISYESTSRRFNIQGILREVIKANYTIKNLPVIRARYCRIFTGVMKEIASKMGTEGYTQAMSKFAHEQPNLQKLLGEVSNTTEETYPFFIEIASSCTDLVEIYLPDESERFYTGCLQLADKYGMMTDKAAVYIAVGSMETHTKGDLLTGARKYELALKIIEKRGRGMQLATLYQKMGWNIFKQGYCEEAIKFYKKSLDISSMAGKEYEPLTLQSLSYLGAAHVVLGKFDLGEKYHTSCLRRSELLQGKVHPKVGDALNRVGLLHDQRGDSDKAMEFFKQGLEIKRKSKAAPISIVYSLSNVANAYNVKGKYEEAHKLVDEAFAILHGQKLNMLDGFSLMYNTRGKIYAQEGKLKEAAEAFGKSVDITREVEQKSYIFMKRLVNLAEVLERQHKLSSSLKLAKEAFGLRKYVIKTLPHNFIVTECLQCILGIYKQTGEREKYIKTLYKMDKECVRLGQVWRDLHNQQKLEKVMETLEELRLQFQCRDQVNQGGLYKSYF